MNRDEVEVEDEKGKMKRVPHPDSVAAWANANGVNVMAAEALHDKLRRLFNKPYIVEKPAADSVAQIIAALEGGKHVVLSYGEHESDLDYLLVSNLLTRKIRNAWEKKTNEFRTHGRGASRGNSSSWWRRRTNCSTARWPRRPRSPPSRANCASITSPC